MFCPNCGAKTDDKDDYCFSCGIKFPKHLLEKSKNTAQKYYNGSRQYEKKVEFTKESTDQEIIEHEKRMEYAGFWIRVVAFLIDIVIILAWIVLITWIDWTWGIVPGLSGNGNIIDFICYIVIGPIAALYIPYMEASSLQATLGKLALKIKVTDLHGDRISFTRALGRGLGKWVLSLCCLGIGFIVAALTEKKQALHDILAGTLVIKEKEKF
ncbi:MAG TPA: RDD family protein [archaeon]|nr:RDD family protein [archaeon]